MKSHTNSAVDLFRHALATLSYRATKTFRDAPDHYPWYRAAEGVRTPQEIVGHLGDLLEWALSLAAGGDDYGIAKTSDWKGAIDRFYGAVRALDHYVATTPDLKVPIERLFQGPVADALTHAGQLAMLRRLADAPIRPENFFRAEIETIPGEAENG